MGSKLYWDLTLQISILYGVYNLWDLYFMVSILYWDHTLQGSIIYGVIYTL